MNEYEYEYLSLVDKVTATVATIDPISWQEAEASCNYLPFFPLVRVYPNAAGWILSSAPRISFKTELDT
jgi:hypothetical protein